jgi:hypothetical protein
MSDLVRGRYPVTNPLAKLVGLAGNATQGNVNVRSNMEWFGLGNITDGALAGTGVACAVAIPVEVGDTFTKVSLLVGAQAEATGTHAFAALYSGVATPALLGQSTDNTGAAALAASAKFDFTLSSAVTVTAATAPGGFIYASIAVRRARSRPRPSSRPRRRSATSGTRPARCSSPRRTAPLADRHGPGDDRLAGREGRRPIVFLW